MYMKTIFISAFEGAEARNVLRTPIFTTLLSDQNLRLVLFMKNRDRVNLYKNEFGHDRVFFEVVARNSSSGLDALFARLKFTMLRTETTDLRRRLIFEQNGNYFAYYTSLILNRLLARHLLRRIFRILDFYLIKNNTYAPYFEKYNPDLVFLAHLFNEPEIDLLREAKRRGVKSVGLINSWDKVTARCVLRLLPDKLIVFNNLIKDELKEFNEVLDENIFVSGLPQLDHYFSNDFSPREEFFRKIGVDPVKKLLVYAPEGSAYSDADWSVIDLLDRLNKEGKFGKNIAVFVRFQPNDFIDENELKKRPDLKYDYPGMRFSSKRGIDWDMNRQDMRHLKDTLRHMSLLVSYGSSMSIDAAIFDKPILHLHFEPKKDLLPHKAPTRFHAMTHAKKAFSSGGVTQAKNENEFVHGIRNYLENPSLHKEERRMLAVRQCQYLDGRSGERIANFILDFIRSK